MLTRSLLTAHEKALHLLHLKGRNSKSMVALSFTQNPLSGSLPLYIQLVLSGSRFTMDFDQIKLRTCQCYSQSGLWVTWPSNGDRARVRCGSLTIECDPCFKVPRAFRVLCRRDYGSGKFAWINMNLLEGLEVLEKDIFEETMFPENPVPICGRCTASGPEQFNRSRLVARVKEKISGEYGNLNQ